MSTILDAYNLLSANNNPLNLNPNYVFNYFIPDTMPDGTNKENATTLTLLRNIQAKPSDFASNKSKSLETKIQVQIWFNYDDPLAEQYEEILRNYLEDNNFQEYYSFIEKDPDINKLFLTAKFINKKFN